MTLRSPRLQPLQFSKNVIWSATMGDIRRTSNYGSGGPETDTFIKYVNGREPQIHEFWCWDIDRICREFYLKVRVEILDGTFGDFVTEYLSGNWQKNHIIGELSINGSVQFIGLSQIWGSGFLYIVNLQAHFEATGWGSSFNGNPGSGTPGSGTITGSWGGGFSHYTVYLGVNWDRYINASPTGSPRIPISPRIARHCARKYLLHCRRQKHLWHQYNCWVCWERQDRDFSDGPTTQ